MEPQNGMFAPSGLFGPPREDVNLQNPCLHLCLRKHSIRSEMMPFQANRACCPGRGPVE